MTSWHGHHLDTVHERMIGMDLARPYGRHGLTALLPVFWACGATAQVALEQARLPIAITHSRAHMVVTDLRSEAFAERP